MEHRAQTPVPDLWCPARGAYRRKGVDRPHPARTSNSARRQQAERRPKHSRSKRQARSRAGRRGSRAQGANLSIRSTLRYTYLSYTILYVQVLSSRSSIKHAPIIAPLLARRPHDLSCALFHRKSYRTTYVLISRLISAVAPPLYLDRGEFSRGILL